MSALNSYLLTGDTSELFNNIVRFAKNMTLKDSKKLYESENTYSSFLGNLLIKYYMEGLSKKDITELLQFVKVFNERLNNTDTKFKAEFYFGVPTVVKTEGENKTYESDTNKINELKDSEKENLLFYKIYKKINEIQETPYTEESICNSIISYLNTNHAVNDGSSIDLKMIDYYYKILEKQQKIFFYVANDSTKDEKAIASTSEINYAECGENIVFFDLENIKVSQGDDLFNAIHAIDDSFDIGSGINNKSESGVNIIVEYKELNEEYRKILMSTYVEENFVLQRIKSGSDEKFFLDYFSNLNADAIFNGKKLYNAIRYEKNPDLYECLIQENSTSDSVRYLRANPFKARRNEESSIISYYYGDYFANLSEGYGQYGFQRKEIQRFLDIFEETREYFYRVLLNKSFITEDEYPGYEKFFLTCVSIERFISSKATILKDIEEMDLNDISNFLQSYGLKELDDIMKENADFVSREYYLKKLIHNHLELIQNKGSKRVIDLLLNIFNYNDDNEIEITKYILVDKELKGVTTQNNETTKKPETTGNFTDNDQRYFFVEIPYSSQNEFKEVMTNLNSGIGYNEFLPTNKTSPDYDKYWSKDTVDLNTLNQLNINSIETKYLSLKNSNDTGALYISSRYIVSGILYLYDKIKSDLLNIEITDDTLANGNISLQDLFFAIITVFQNFVYNKDYATQSEKIKFYGINPNAANEINNKIDGWKSRLKYIRERYIADSNDVLRNLENDLDSVRDIIKIIANYNNNNQEKIDSGKFAEMLEKLISFPIDYIVNGKYTNRKTEDNWNADFEKLFSEVFETIFLTDKDVFHETHAIKNTSLKNYVENTDVDDITKLTKLISIANDFFKSYEKLKFYLSITESEASEIKFIETAIKYFISYTTQFKQSRLIKKFDYKSEIFNVADKVEGKEINRTETDMFLYDEEFLLREETENE